MLQISDKEEPMTKKEYQEAIEWAESEVKEYKNFIKTCKNRIVFS